MSKIKLIVEIDEEDYGDFCDWFESVPSSVDGLPCVKGKFNTALYDAKPVDTSGDLIRREDLKKTIKDNGYSHYFEIFEIIDNAPTVELSPVINMKPLTAEEKQGLIDALKKSRLKVIKLDDEGIRGEWARYDEWVNGEYTGGFYHVNCPVIEEGYALYSRWETRFCPNCGAPMKSGGEKE